MAEAICIGGLTLRFLQDKHSIGGRLDLLEMAVPPQGRMPVAHSHLRWEETIYGLSGTITFTVAEELRRIGSGQTLLSPAVSCMPPPMTAVRMQSACAS